MSISSTPDCEYYFINKGRNSVHLSQGSRSQQAAIQSYVQTGRKRNRRTKLVFRAAQSHSTSKEHKISSPNSASSASKLRSPNAGLQVEVSAKVLGEKHPPKPNIQRQEDKTPVTNPHHVQDTQTSKPDIRLLFVDSNPKRSHKGRELEDSERKSHAARETHRKRLARSGRAQQITAPTSQAILHRTDPFDSASVKIDNTVAGLLHYYLYFYHPTIWPNEMTVLRRGLYTFQGAVNNVMRMAIGDKLSMYCLLSAAASRIQFIDRLPCPQVVGKEGYYVHNALQLLRSRIENADFHTSEQLLICIIFLTSAEAYRDEVWAAKTHLQAAVGILERMGGLMQVENENLRGQLAMADLYLACIRLEPCLFECDYDPGPGSTLSLKEAELYPLDHEATATSLLNRDDCIVPSSLKGLIEQLLESYTIKIRLQTSSMSPLRAMKVTHWITKRNMAIRNRLLAFNTSDPRVDSLRVAIIMWTLLTMNVTGRTKTVRVMAPMLRQVLAETTTLDWIGEEDIKLWILLVGFSCATEGSKESVWYTQQCCNFSSRWRPTDQTENLETCLAERLENFQVSFFFDAEVQRPRTQNLAKQLIQMRLS